MTLVHPPLFVRHLFSKSIVEKELLPLEHIDVLHDLSTPRKRRKHADRTHALAVYRSGQTCVSRNLTFQRALPHYARFGVAAAGNFRRTGSARFGATRTPT